MHENLAYLHSIGWQATSESGTELRGKCPYPQNHDGGLDENPSFSINSQNGNFNCKACNEGGKSIITMLMLVERISKEEAMKKVFGSLNEEERMLSDLRMQIKTLTHSILTRDLPSIPQDVLDARKDVAMDLEKRGLSLSVIEKYQIGFTYHSLIKKLIKTYSLQQIEQSGLVRKGLFFTVNRMSIPIISEKRLIGFSLRSLDGTQPKYQNIYNEHESKWFFNLDRKNKEVFVTEGAFDAISLSELGFNACASMGTSISRERIKLLTSFEKVYLVMDADKAGVQAVKKFIDNSRGTLDATLINVVNLPDGKDPDECTPDEVARAVENSVNAFAWLINVYAVVAKPEQFIIGMKKLRKMVVNYHTDEARIFELMIDNRLETYTQTEIQRYYEVDCVTDIVTKHYEVKT